MSDESSFEQKQEESVQSEESEQADTIYLCRCLLGDPEVIEIPPRKKHILSTVTRTEEYLRERRIPELMRFLLTKVLATGPAHPVAYLEKLLNDSMLFRRGHALAPVLYEDRHLQAVIKSFDPGNRGWLSSGQIRRAFNTLGLTLKGKIDDRIPADVAFEMLQKTQEKELFNLISAGCAIDDDVCSCNDTSTTESKEIIRNYKA